jgi:outer membrane protein/adhesin transport system outer membrane protein
MHDRIKAIGLAGVALAAALGLGVAAPAQAQPLMEVLATTYNTNPTLAAQRESLRATNESVAQALSAYRPSVSADASVSSRWSQSETGFGTSDEEVNPASIGIRVDQPIYDFGRDDAVDAAEFGVQAARANYLAIEQRVMLDAITAYVDVVRDQALLDLARNNEQVLRQQLQATRDRFEVGEVTRTDVAQAESRVAGAVARVVSSEGQLSQSRATFTQITGMVPGTLLAPDAPTQLPVSLEEAIIMAEAGSPVVVAAEFAEQAAIELIAVEEGSLLPRFSASAEARHTENPSSLADSQSSFEVRLQMTWQLYQGGLASSQIREQQYLANQRRIEIDEARREAVEAAISAWERLAAARASIDSLEASVRSASIALEGVRQEAQVGSRTVLDVLDAEQELLQQRTDLIEAQRNEVLAGYVLQAAVGRLTARDLALAVELYDFGPDYERARNTWYGTRID